MVNRIIIDKVSINGNRIEYGYKVEGEWTEAFNSDEEFFIEYSVNMSEVPESIAIIPILANVLPMSWVYDAEIICPCCDKTFYESVPEIKKGYMEMYPGMDFKGKLLPEKIEENHMADNKGTAAFFSGGVDAFGTLIRHYKENPTLLTIWGADIKLGDEEGWKRVSNHIASVAEEFSVGFIKIKSSFRTFVNEEVLGERVKKSGDLWWHGFQHGIGIISHAAPISHILGLNKVYIASSFHISQKGQYKCASDPTIDNFVKFSDSQVIHDGYELTRQDKVNNITAFSKKTGRKIQLRVCWKSIGGTNCCFCEKCFRTMLGIYAQGFNPRDFGFDCTEEEFSDLCKKMKKSRELTSLRYGPIQDSMRKKYKKKEIYKSLRWFYDKKKSKIGYHPLLATLERIKALQVRSKQKIKRLGKKLLKK